MMIELLRNARDISGELRKLKKYAPEIKLAFRYFDQDKNPKEALEKIRKIVRNCPVLDDFFKFGEIYDLVLRGEQRAKKRNWDWGYACQEALKETGVNYKIIGEENIPEDGGGLWISNHPWGTVDSMILIAGLYPRISKKGGKLKIIVMNQLRFIEGLEKIAIFVHSTVKGPNIAALRESLKHLDEGGDLAIYPSGRMSKAGLKEYPWKKGLENFVSHSSYVVPMWFSGPNHATIYNFLSKLKITEGLRRAFSLREVCYNVGNNFVLNIGKPISSEKLIKPEEPKEKRYYRKMRQSLREKAEALKVAL